jgi:hypothetical protein
MVAFEVHRIRDESGVDLFLEAPGRRLAQALTGWRSNTLDGRIGTRPP